MKRLKLKRSASSKAKAAPKAKAAEDKPAPPAKLAKLLEVLSYLTSATKSLRLSEELDNKQVVAFTLGGEVRYGVVHEEKGKSLSVKLLASKEDDEGHHEYPVNGYRLTDKSITIVAESAKHIDPIEIGDYKGFSEDKVNRDDRGRFSEGGGSGGGKDDDDKPSKDKPKDDLPDHVTAKEVRALVKDTHEAITKLKEYRQNYELDEKGDAEISKPMREVEEEMENALMMVAEMLDMNVDRDLHRIADRVSKITDEDELEEIYDMLIGPMDEARELLGEDEDGNLELPDDSKSSKVVDFKTLYKNHIAIKKVDVSSTRSTSAAIDLNNKLRDQIALLKKAVKNTSITKVQRKQVDRYLKEVTDRQSELKKKFTIR